MRRATLAEDGERRAATDRACERLLSLIVGRQQGIDELPCHERSQVVDALPDPDELERDGMLLCYSRHDAALGAPVELGDDQAGEPDRRIERLDLGEAVLPGVRIQHEEYLVRRARQR